MKPLVRSYGPRDAPEEGGELQQLHPQQASRIGAGSFNTSPSSSSPAIIRRCKHHLISLLDAHLNTNDTHQRKKLLLLLLSTLFLSLFVMVMAKGDAVGVEKRITVPGRSGEEELHGKGVPPTVENHLDHHLVDGGVVGAGGSSSGSAAADVVDGTKSDEEHVLGEETKAEASTVVSDAIAEKNGDIPPATAASTSSKVVIHNVDTTPYQSTEYLKPTYFLPKTQDAPRGSAAGGGWDYPVTNHFQYRNVQSPTVSNWGYFDFEDPTEEWRGKVRPQPDFSTVEHRDVKSSDFPEGAWQKDDAYMKRFLEEAKNLVNRTIEGVYAEYGVGVAPFGGDTLTDEQLVQREEFAPYAIIQDIENDEEFRGKGNRMWMTQNSLDGLARRLIHAIMTNDSFELVLGGHSAAAGHGNAFNQSYIIQAGHVLEPVFAHLGVWMRAYNFAQGGMGTLQQALAGMDLRGNNADMIMWDSGMTEKGLDYFMFFVKQALISGNRAPFIIGVGNEMRPLEKVAGANIGEHGSGWNGPLTQSEQQAAEVPWAARYLNCERGNEAICKQHEYESGCWVDRDDFTPSTAQDKQPGGQTSWHPGNRIHKIRGRRIALMVLRGLQYALQKWEDLTAESGHPLADEHWHVADYYKSIREKAPEVPGCFAENKWKIGQKRRRNLRTKNETTPSDGRQLEEEDYWPSRLCNIPLQGRSLWGPRYNPMESSLVSILKPNPMGDLDPDPNPPYMWAPIYQPPDLPGSWYVPPEEDVNVDFIASARKLAVDNHNRELKRTEKIVSRATTNDIHINSTRQLAEITPGYGTAIMWGRSGHCDGTSHNWCDKSDGISCLMGGTQDNRGSVCFDGTSGWVVFDVKDVKHGFIGARMEPWRKGESQKITKGWTEENNGGKGNYDKTERERRLHAEYTTQRSLEYIEQMEKEIENDILMEDPNRRRLGGGQSCGVVGDYTFEWAINGEIVSWTKAEFCDHFTRLSYNLDVIKFMDDPSKTGDFEVAMRMTNTDNNGQMCITHLYWA